MKTNQKFKIHFHINDSEVSKYLTHLFSLEFSPALGGGGGGCDKEKNMMSERVMMDLLLCSLPK